MSNELYIIGAGDFGREIVALVKRINACEKSEEKKYNILGFIDDNKLLKNSYIEGFPVIGNLDYLNKINHPINVVCSVATGAIREKIVNKITNKYVSFPVLKDPSAIFFDDMPIGEGSIVCANSVVSINVTIGKHCIINLGCTLGHDVILSPFCTINPGTNLSGKVLCEKCVDIGTGTKIIQGLTIKENTTVGAGTVVIRDLQSNVTAVGNPARIVKYK